MACPPVHFSVNHKRSDPSTIVLYCPGLLQGLGAAWASVAADGAAPLAAAAAELRSPLLAAAGRQQQQLQQPWAALALLQHQQRGYAKQYAPTGAYATPAETMRPGSVSWRFGRCCRAVRPAITWLAICILVVGACAAAARDCKSA